MIAATCVMEDWPGRFIQCCHDAQLEYPAIHFGVSLSSDLPVEARLYLHRSRELSPDRLRPRSLPQFALHQLVQIWLREECSNSGLRLPSSSGKPGAESLKQRLTALEPERGQKLMQSPQVLSECPITDILYTETITLSMRIDI
jgi:hypothetical protein